MLEIECPGQNGAKLTLSLSELQSLPFTEFETSTIWTKGLQKFGGVKLADLLELHGIKTGSIELLALNDYTVELPVREALAEEGLIAYQINGSAFPVRQKGPLWLVFPFDAKAKYQTQVYYSRSIWNLHKLKCR